MYKSNSDTYSSTGLQELLNLVEHSAQWKEQAQWHGRAILVLPERGGYFARTQCFQERFVGCKDLGILYDRSVFGRRAEVAKSEQIEHLLDGSVLMLVQSSDDDTLSDKAIILEEVNSRIKFQWLFDHEPPQKTLALVDGHLNLESYLPLVKSAEAMGIRVVVLDRPDHWITDPSLRHLYHDFIPIDMTPDDGFHQRIATAVKDWGHVDGICAIASYCLAPVAKAAALLGLPTESPEAIVCAINKWETRQIAGGAGPTTLVSNVEELKEQMAAETYVPEYPLIVKPGVGTGSAHVYRADSEAELLESVRRTAEGSSRKVLVETYIDGPELDINFVLLDGEVLFFDVSDDFPAPGDNGNMESDFWENIDLFPSRLPEKEYSVVRESMHELLLKIGLRTGVFHLEGRVQDSSMAYSEVDGLIDLREREKPTSSTKPRCFLIEVNPRPPGMPCVLTAIGVYGVDMYGLHVLACLGDHERLRAFSRPFEKHGSIPNFGRAYSQLVWLRADQGGVCSSDDVFAEPLKKLTAKERELVTESMCFFHRGQRIPEPKPGVILFGAFFVVTSRTNRDDVLRVSLKLQEGFTIPVDA